MMNQSQTSLRFKPTIGRRVAVLLGTLAVLCGGAAFGDFSSDFHSEKTVTWDISSKGVIVGGPNTGMYRYAYHAFAEDAHDKIQHKDNANQTGGFFTTLADHLNPDAKTPNATVV